MLMSRLFFAILLGTFALPVLSFRVLHGSSLPKLKILTYSSFVSKWGPGQILKERFEKTCLCEIEYKKTEDAAAILTQVKIDPKRVLADVVIGLDQNLILQAAETRVFASQSTAVVLHEKIQSLAHHGFVPFDFGPMTFMADTQKVKTLPDSLQTLISLPEFKQKLILQDPRTSSPGLGILIWILKLAKGDKSLEKEFLQKLRMQTLTVTKSWSESYGFFTKGEAPFVWSYATSELYHRIEEKTDRYKAVYMKEGHPLQIEYAGVVKKSSQATLAAKFVNFLLQPENQLTIATKNWMLPALPFSSIADLPKEFLEINRFLSISTSELTRGSSDSLKLWRQNFRLPKK